MSSILDALERAAQERGPGNAGMPPTLPVTGEPPSPVGRSAVLALLVIAVAAAAWLLFADQAGQAGNRPVEKGRAASPPAQSETTATPEMVVVSQSQPHNKPLPPRAASAVDRIRSSGQANQRPLVSEAILSTPPQPDASPPVPGPEPVSVGEVAARGLGKGEPVAMPPAGDLAPKVAAAARPQPLAPAPERREEKTASAAPVAQEAADRGREAEQQIPLIWELDQGLREELERLEMSIHVYHRVATQRFVIINMRRYVEGDSLGVNGYRLHAIDRDGIVIDHGNGLVRLLRER